MRKTKNKDNHNQCRLLIVDNDVSIEDIDKDLEVSNVANRKQVNRQIEVKDMSINIQGLEKVADNVKGNDCKEDENYRCLEDIDSNDCNSTHSNNYKVRFIDSESNYYLDGCHSIQSMSELCN